MINHYSSNALHEAHRRDLMNEAKGGWLLKQARGEAPMPESHRLIRRVVPIVLIGMALAVSVLQFARVP